MCVLKFDDEPLCAELRAKYVLKYVDQLKHAVVLVGSSCGVVVNALDPVSPA